MVHVENHENDVDFDDMFGGPMTHSRYSFGNGRIMSSDESSTSFPFGLGERPVFVELYSLPRRPTSDDFYNSILGVVVGLFAHQDGLP